MKIAIFGSLGFLGTKLKNVFLKSGHQILGIDNNESSEFKIDATNFEQVSSFLEKERPDLIIDTIGLTSSLECEKYPNKAILLNYKTAKNISQASKKINIPLIFISSSYVFDGKKGNYSEEDKPSPLNEYGKTKVLAEKEILKLKKGIVLRVDIMYGFNGFKKQNGIFQKVLLNKDITLEQPNQIRQPLFVDDLPSIIIDLVKKEESGIFHVAGPDRLKMKKFILSLGKIIREEIKIGGDKIKEELRIPEKPTFNISKLNSFGIKTTPFEEASKIIKKQITSEQL